MKLQFMHGCVMPNWDRFEWGPEHVFSIGLVTMGGNRWTRVFGIFVDSMGDAVIQWPSLTVYESFVEELRSITGSVLSPW